MKRILNDLQVIDAYKLYNEQKLSTYQVAKLFNCNATTLQKEFKKAGLSVRDSSHAKQKYPINENIFDIIDTEEKAYWLGFLYADGNVSKTNRVRLSLAETDKEIINKFSNFIFNCERVKCYKQPPLKLSQDLAYVDVCNKHIALKLTELGCPPKKTFILKYPEWLDVKLQNHFIRGYFDGDGCLSLYKEKRKGRGLLTSDKVISEYDKSKFSILSTIEFLTSLQDIFNKLNVNSYLSKRHKNRNNNNYNLTVNGNLQVHKLMNWLYKDATIFLQRKYENYLQLGEINAAKKVF